MYDLTLPWFGRPGYRGYLVVLVRFCPLRVRVRRVWGRPGAPESPAAIARALAEVGR